MLMKPDQFALGMETLDREARAQPNFLTRLIYRLEAYAEHRRQRHALRSLDDHMLKDIGIGRAEAEHIAAKPFDWSDVPAKTNR
jgi:uncharacterized protein YjiS (DUF1127 family)